ncbi:MAG: hypothetical protein ACOC4G_07400 [Bacillota bacterium]
MKYLYLIMFILLVISYIYDRKKTYQSLQRGWMKITKILPGYLKLLILLSLVLLIPEEIIAQFLGGSNVVLGVLLGLIIGSITMMPGFIAYPLAGILVGRGVSYMVIAAFISTLMLVGILTYPVEKEYMGVKATILRNAASFGIAALIAIATGVFYGEVF